LQLAHFLSQNSRQTILPETRNNILSREVRLKLYLGVLWASGLRDVENTKRGDLSVQEESIGNVADSSPDRSGVARRLRPCS
jgi:hypothetical protein